MMKTNSSKAHHMDALFPITLFFVLTLFAFMVIVLASQIYENTTENSHRNHQARIALSYISEKIHQADDECIISIEEFDSLDALTFYQTYEGVGYYTYIYYYEGALRELFAREGTILSLSDGKAVLSLQEFSMIEADENLLYFSCTDMEDQFADSYVSISK